MQKNLRKHLKLTVAIGLFTVLAGCQTMDSNFSAFMEDKPEFGLPETVLLPKDHRQIAGKSKAENMVYNAIELAKQKRYTEANNLLREVRDLQYRGSEGFHGLTNTIAILALRKGDLPAFKRLGSQLDISLGKPLKVPTKHLPVVSLVRVLQGEPLPLNASQRMTSFRDSYLPESASLN